MLEETITSTTTTLNLSDGPVSISADGTYIITQNITEENPTTPNTITVSSGVSTTIILDGVNIKAANPFNAQNASDVTLILKGENTIESTGWGAAVSCPEGEEARLTIKEYEVQGGSLKASVTGYNHLSSGIGYNADSKGSIIIESGTIDARGGGYSAGIGQANGVKGGTIIIKGGTIEAYGGDRGAGIGTGLRGGKISIIIEGGSIKAFGGFCGPGIGNADHSERSTIKISNGHIKAEGGGHAAGIGGALEDEGGEINISGGEISAKGGYNSSGIGMGDKTLGQAITIFGV